MSDIIKGNEIKTTLALTNGCIAFAVLSAYSPESSRPMLVIAATALGIAALYPLYLLMQKPRRYRITKVTEGYETVYIIRYKGFLWWYNATRSNGKTIAFKSMDEAMQYIRENVVMDMINRKTRQKNIKRESTVVYDSISQPNDVDTSNPFIASNDKETESDGTSQNIPQPSDSSNDMHKTGGVPNTITASESSKDKNTETSNSPDDPNTSVSPTGDKQQLPHAPDSTKNAKTGNDDIPAPSGSSNNNTATIPSSNSTATPTNDSQEANNTGPTTQKAIPQNAKNVIQATAFLNAVATRQQKDDEEPAPPKAPDTLGETEGKPTTVPTDVTAEEKTNESEDIPHKTEDNNNESTTPGEDNNANSQTTTPANPQNTDGNTDISETLFDVMDSFSNKNKRRQPHQEKEDKGEGNKDIPIRETIKEESKKEEIYSPQNQGKSWTQLVGEMRLSHGNNPQLVSGSLNMIHQHRMLEQEKTETSQNADKDAPDGKTPPSTPQGKETQNNPHEDKPKEEIQTKTIRPDKPSAEQRYLKAQQKAAQKQKAKQTSLYDLPEFSNNTMGNSHESPTTDTKNNNASAESTDSSKGNPTSSGGQKIAKKPEEDSSPTLPKPQPPSLPSHDPPTENTNGDFHNGSESPAEEPQEDEEMDYGYTDNGTTPNIIMVTPPYPGDIPAGDTDDLPI